MFILSPGIEFATLEYYIHILTTFLPNHLNSYEFQVPTLTLRFFDTIIFTYTNYQKLAQTNDRRKLKLPENISLMILTPIKKELLKIRPLRGEGRKLFLIFIRFSD